MRTSRLVPVSDRFFRREMMLAPDAGDGNPGGSFVSFEPPAASPAATPGGPPQLPPNPLAAPATPPADSPANPGQPATPEVLDFGGRKVPVVDPEIKNLHSDYLELTRTLQQRDQLLRQAEQTANLAQTQVQLLMQQQQQLQQQQQPAAPQLTPEEIQAQNEKWMENFYANPQGAIAELLKQQVQPILKQEIDPLRQVLTPLQQERQLIQQVNQLNTKYPDFNQYQGHVQQLVQQNPGLLDNPNGLEYAYLQAKTNVLSQQQAQPAATPEQLIQDPNIRNQLINDPNIRNEVIRQYLAGVQQQQSQQAAPPVMGNQPGGQPPVLPQNTPKNLRDGTKAFMAAMGMGSSSQQ